MDVLTKDTWSKLIWKTCSCQRNVNIHCLHLFVSCFC